MTTAYAFRGFAPTVVDGLECGTTEGLVHVAADRHGTYGTEGHRFESCRARSEKACVLPHGPFEGLRATLAPGINWASMSYDAPSQLRVPLPGAALRRELLLVSKAGAREVAATGARAPPPDAPAGARPSSLCEFDYLRGGPLAYLAAWDVHHARIFGRVEAKTGIEPFGRLVDEVMSTEPYASARRVFWIVDNGSSHAGKRSIERLEGAYPNLRLIHLPVHASWLNQIELYFSIVQRKALTPNDFSSLEQLSERLLGFQAHYAKIARPFEWTFSRADLDRVIERIEDREPRLRLVA